VVDHDSGAYACQTERRAVVRVPAASNNTSSVRAFQVGQHSGTMMMLDGKSFTHEAALEYAAKIVATCDQVTR
jgi:hypothetical protein